MALQNRNAEALSGRSNRKAKDAFQLARLPAGRSGSRKDVGTQMRLGRTGSGRTRGIESQMRLR